MCLFYLFAPIPILIARRYQEVEGASNACKELALFLTAGIVISAYGLPLILAHANNVIKWSAAILTICGNCVVFPTILGFFIAFDNEDDAGYSMWG